MSVSVAHKASTFSGSNAASYATGSWTPGANRLAIACVENEIGSGTPTTPTLSGNGITWSQLATYVNDSTGTQVRCTVFVAKTGGSPSAGAVTADFGGVTQAGCNVVVDEADGVDVSGTSLQAIVQSKTGSVNASATSESISLDSGITSGNASYGMFTHQADETSTNGSGYTTLGNGSHAGPSSAVITEYKAAGAQTVDASWTTSAGKGGIALEIKAAASGQTIAAGQTSETDTAQTVGRVKSKGIGQNTETDLAQAIARVKRLALGLNSETDSAFAMTVRKTKAVGQNTESDAALSITPAKRYSVGLVSETDIAQPITEAGAQVIAVGQVSETDAAQMITVRKVLIVAQVSETDLAQQLFPSKRVAIAQVIETDLSQALAHIKSLGISQASETDLAQSITIAGPIIVAVGIAIETDSALSITLPGSNVDVELHVPARSLEFTLVSRDLDLTLHTHTTALTLEDA